MAETPNREWSKVARVAVFSGIVIFAAFTATAIMVCRNSAWHAELVRFISRVWHTLVTYDSGGTSPGFFGSILLSLLFIIIVALKVKAPMKPEYHEGPEGLEGFDKTMTALFRAPKTVSTKKKTK